MSDLMQNANTNVWKIRRYALVGAEESSERD